MATYTLGTFNKKTKTIQPNTSYTSISANAPTQKPSYTPVGATSTQKMTYANPTTPVANKNPYGVASMADGSVRYSDGSTQPNANTTPQTTSTPSYLDTFYKDYIGQIGKQESQRQATSTEEQQLAKDENAAYIKQQQALADQTDAALKAQKPVFKKRSEQAQALINKGLEAVNTQGARAKSNIQDQTGDTMRTQAQAKRETDSKRNAIFAGNNTSDSFGVGGYQLEQTNADSEFLRNQNKTLRDRDSQLADVDSQLTGAQVTAEQAINDEVSKYEDALSEIDFKLGNNQIAKQNAQDSAYATLKKSLFDIRKSYNTDTNELFKTKMELMKTYLDDSAKAQQPQEVGTDKLSPEFIMSGMQTPKTYADQLYMQTKGKTGNGEVSRQAIGLIDSLRNMDTKGITGKLQVYSMIPGTAAQVPKAYYEQLKGLLSLDNIKMMKGQGQISDAERALLEKASTRINRNLSDTDFQNELLTLRNELSRGLQGSTQTDVGSRYTLVSVE